MIIINPADTTHTIEVIPRYMSIANAHTMSIKSDATRTIVTPSNTTSMAFGYITYIFDLVTTEGSGYDVKIVDNVTTNIVWRGKIFSTAQITQNYKIHE